MMKRQDPTFHARENEETGQTLISGMGELHLEVIKHRLLRDYRLNVRVHKPRVSYRETIARAVEVDRPLPPQRGRPDAPGEAGHPHGAESFAGQADRDAGPAARRPCPRPSWRPPWKCSANMPKAAGPWASRCMHLKVTVLGGQTHETESNELAFRFAAADAFNEGLREAGIVLLEPIMKIEVTTPEENLGDIVSDLQQRRAIITRTQARGRITVIDAQAPLANLFGYSNAMRGLSQGRATCTMEPVQLRSRPAGGAGELLGIGTAWVLTQSGSQVLPVTEVSFSCLQVVDN